MSLNALTFRLAAHQLILTSGAVAARLSPVHSNDPNNPNTSFSKSTPTAAFDFTITNQDAFDFLKPGDVYDLVMIPSNSGYGIQLIPPIGLSDAIGEIDQGTGSVTDTGAPIDGAIVGPITGSPAEPTETGISPTPVPLADGDNSAPVAPTPSPEGLAAPAPDASAPAIEVATAPQA